MSEENKKKVPDTELNLEDLNQVAGGGILDQIGNLPKPDIQRRAYVCEICGFPVVFTSETEYKAHMKSAHNIDK